MITASDAPLSRRAVLCPPNRFSTKAGLDHSDIVPKPKSSKGLRDPRRQPSQLSSQQSRKRSKNKGRPKRQITPVEVVLPSIERSRVKRVLESGIEYSARHLISGAGEPIQNPTAAAIFHSQLTPGRRSESLPVDGLTTDLGKDVDDDWRPPVKFGAGKPARSKQTKKSSSKHDIIEQGNDFRHTLSCESSPSINIVKREPLADHIDLAHGDSQGIPSCVSPPIWNCTLRQEKLLEAGFVELPKEVMEYEQTEKELTAKGEFIRKQQRREKGKSPERYPREAAWDTKEEDLQQTMQESGEYSANPRDIGKHARPNPLNQRRNIQKPRLCDENTTVKIEELQAKSPTRKHVPHGPPFSDKSVEQSEPNVPTATGSWESQRIGVQYRGWKRGHSALSPRPKDCTCAMLPEFFTKNWYHIPDMATWHGSDLEFLVHTKQISTCRGHPQNVKRHCQRVLKEAKYPDELGIGVAMDFSHGMSSPTADHQNSGVLSQSSDSCARSFQQLSSIQKAKQASQPARSGSCIKECRASGVDPVGLNTPQSSRFNKQNHRSSVQAKRLTKELDPGPLVGDTENCVGSPQPSQSPARSLLACHNVRSAVRDGHEKHCDGQMSTPTTNVQPETFRGRAQSKSPCVMKQRYRSMPAVSTRRVVVAAGNVPRTSQPEQPRRDNTWQISTTLNTLVDAVNSIKSMLLPPVTIPTDQNPRSDPVAPTARAVPAPQPPPSKKRKTNAERRAGDQPEFDRNVPYHLRLPDDALINIGRIINSYERHTKAPYTFAWNGRLWSDYDRLLTTLDENGNHMWDCKTMSRLKR